MNLHYQLSYNPCPGPIVSDPENCHFSSPHFLLTQHHGYKPWDGWWGWGGEEPSVDTGVTPGLPSLGLPQKAPGRSHFFASAGDGHVDFKDFLAVMTDTKRFFCSVGEQRGQPWAVRAGKGPWRLMGDIDVPESNGGYSFMIPEQNVLMDMSPRNPYTLFFEILSLLVEMLALPELALEEITK